MILRRTSIRSLMLYYHNWLVVIQQSVVKVGSLWLLTQNWWVWPLWNVILMHHGWRYIPNNITKHYINYKPCKPSSKISLPVVVVVIGVEIIPIRTLIIIPTHLLKQQPKEEKLPCTVLVAYSRGIPWEFLGNREVLAIWTGTHFPKGSPDSIQWSSPTRSFPENRLSGIREWSGMYYTLKNLFTRGDRERKIAIKEHFYVQFTL